jgi:putative ABC transport system permease protein
MKDVAVSYIAAFKAPAKPGFDNALTREFPNITNIDVSVSIGQIQRVLDQVIRAVEFLFGFTLAAGLVVLFAAVTATRESRAREFAVMRAMGASSRLLAQVQRAAMPSNSTGTRRPSSRWRAARPVHCSRLPRAGGACVKCCAGP